MKSTALFMYTAALLCSTLSVVAQSEKFVYPDAFYFVKEVDVRAYAGKKVQFEISVKAMPFDTLSRVRVYAIQCRKGREDFIASTLKYAQHQEGEWQQYMVSETIEPDAQRIWFYCAVNGNGDFCFDDLKIYMEDEHGFLHHAETVNPSFENKQVLKGYYHTTSAKKEVTAFADKKIKSSGQQSLHIRCAGNKPAPTILPAAQ